MVQMVKQPSDRYCFCSARLNGFRAAPLSTLLNNDAQTTKPGDTRRFVPVAEPACGPHASPASIALRIGDPLPMTFTCHRS
jgi:hypothetical protein